MKTRRENIYNLIRTLKSDFHAYNIGTRDNFPSSRVWHCILRQIAATSLTVI